MIQTNKSRFDITQENLHTSKDSRVLVPNDPYRRKSNELYERLIFNIKTYPFIVDWQLPDIELCVAESPPPLLK